MGEDITEFFRYEIDKRGSMIDRNHASRLTWVAALLASMLGGISIILSDLNMFLTQPVLKWLLYGILSSPLLLGLVATVVFSWLKIDGIRIAQQRDEAMLNEIHKIVEGYFDERLGIDPQYLKIKSLGEIE